MKKMNLNIRIHQLATLVSGVLLTSVCVAHFNKSFPEQTLTVLETETNMAGSVKKIPVNAKKLAKLHLFGVATKDISPSTTLAKSNHLSFQPVDSVVDPAKLPPTALNLSINGLFTHVDYSKGHAIISDSRGESRSYKVGDSITSNVKLHSVYTNYAVVNNNNKLESLKLPDFKTGGAKKSQQAINRNFARQFPDRKRDS